MDGIDLIIYLCGFFSIIILSGTLFNLFYEAFRNLKLRLDKKRFNDLINIQIKINEVLNEYYKIKKKLDIFFEEENEVKPCNYINWYYDNVRMEWIFYNIKTNKEIDSITRHQYDHLRKNKNDFEDYLNHLNYKIKRDKKLDEWRKELKNKKEENNESL